MESEKWIKKITTVFTEIERRLVNPSFKFSQGGATSRTLANFINQFDKEFGAVTEERLVDFCICTAYAFRSRESWTVKQAFGPSSIKRLKESKHGARYYEDQWLQEKALTREQLLQMIADRSEHPLAKYIYMPAEESTKRRLLNKKVGYAICQSSTLGWSPLSCACGNCEFINDCKKETELKYPELYRIRVEYGKSSK
ncbi:MAG: hypothetical protein IKQ20_03295 [Bacteroidales bacterium]|nr:hypothetical protein [Bacteroidales bacterium]